MKCINRIMRDAVKGANYLMTSNRELDKIALEGGKSIEVLLMEEVFNRLKGF